MSSTLDLTAIYAAISSLEDQVKALKTMLGSSGNPPAPSVDGGKGKRKGKNGGKKASAVAADGEPVTKKDRPATPWRLFSDRVREVLKGQGLKGNVVGIECLQFAGALKDENKDLDSWTDDLILARHAAWSPPQVSKAKAASANNSVVSEGKPKKERKPRAKLSEEQKAANKEARKASKKAAAPVVADNVAPVTVVADTVVAPAPAPAPTPSAGGFRKASVRGGAYLVNIATGHAYKRQPDGSQGDWAGIFHRDGFTEDNGPWIDDSVAEPVAEEDELIF